MEETTKKYTIKAGKELLAYATFSSLLCAYGMKAEVHSDTKVLNHVIKNVAYSKDVIQDGEIYNEDHSDKHSDTHHSDYHHSDTHTDGGSGGDDGGYIHC